MLEIIGMTVEDAKSIEKCGADRIELVSALTEGGLTPSYGLIESVVNSVDIPVNVMIRHHANGFVYSEEDLKIMKKDIQIVKDSGANGVVLGVLDEKNNINEKHLIELLNECDGLDVTFHRAIDDTDLNESMKILKKYEKITNILTSGGKKTITENINEIKDTINEEKRINILLGGGLNFDNIDKIKKFTKATDFHFGTAVRVDNNPFKGINEDKLKKLVCIIKL
ncbi:copper homeostasis protein CutC [Terrisporobacter mayombei]|uniref:PF03932 family protein CutC n=1 Tax=Terrisporobacter mayombei TaxID=1541 RepID=A0ABY9Q541_9FIRM|nr:copper homeostasis protein CutC [Terrisporobacter mayombei]MCC3870121.1 copper homeostasis protein CutC [Terrisporobacter mayombei]WMT82359.1 Copper homeostasis protein CutC [Terrisporobacter mayombei]